MILTVTDAKGVEIDTAGEGRIEPIAGNDLTISLDMNIQSYATQLALQAMEAKGGFSCPPRYSSPGRKTDPLWLPPLTPALPPQL